MEGAVSFKSRADIPSAPVALFTFSERNMSVTSSSSMVENLKVVWAGSKVAGGPCLELLITLVMELKCELNALTMVLLLVSSRPFS